MSRSPSCEVRLESQRYVNYEKIKIAVVSYGNLLDVWRIGYILEFKKDL
jgi:hypothetical protein